MINMVINPKDFRQLLKLLVVAVYSTKITLIVLFYNQIWQ